MTAAGKLKCAVKHLRHYYEIQPVKVQPRQYTDVLYTYPGWVDMIPDGLDAKGRPAAFWYKDTALTKKHKLRARLNGDKTKECIYAQRFGVGFDIETTTYTERDNHGRVVTCEGYAYHMQIIVGTVIIHCCEWWQVISVFDTLRKKLHLGEVVKNCKLMCRMWDANLAFEFAFLSHRLHWVDIFAAVARKPITAESDIGIILQDCLMISGTSLEKTAKMYDLPTRKTHDLDYDKVRHSKTPLTVQEIEYCSCDVRILSEWHEWCMINFVDNGLDIPITKTQMLRDSIKKCFNDTEMHNGRLSGFARRLASLHFADYDTYSEMIRMLFRGGYSHANSAFAGDIIHHVGGWDFTSSYPYAILFCEYPVTEFMDVENVKTLDDITQMDDAGYAVICKVTLYDVENRTPHSIESISKTFEWDEAGGMYDRYKRETNAIVDNGRILAADKMTVWLTELDLRIYRLFYKWDDSATVIHTVKAAGKGLLPDYVRWPIMVYYGRKCRLKKQGLDGTTEYKLAKELANSGYGMMCEKLHLTDIVYDQKTGQWEEVNPEPAAVDDEYLQEILGEKCIAGYAACRNKLPAVWGIYTTAIARYRLLETVAKIGWDALYCDTDSVYAKNPEKYADIINDINQEVISKNRALIKYWNRTHKKTAEIGQINEDEFYDLGTFDPICKKHDPPVYDSFKMLGAKRYIKTCGTDTETTVAGLPKTALTAYCTAKGLDVYEIFDDKMVIPQCKNAHCYNDYQHTRTITDYNGTSYVMSEMSSCGIFAIDFSMRLSSDYYALITEGIEAIQRKYYKGEWAT